MNWLAVSKHHLVQWHKPSPVTLTPWHMSLFWSITAYLLVINHKNSFNCNTYNIEQCTFLVQNYILTHAHKFHQQYLDSPLPSEWYKEWQEETPKCVLIQNLPRHPKWWAQEHNIGCPVKLMYKASTLY